ncbi:MAG: sterol desaturase family protein [Saprospiraceae bacterium]|nr:sterol desaturase family protein [Saprospiraceae bacterium]
MPTPLELLSDPVSQIILAMYALMFAWESLLPARTLPPLRFWKIRGIAMFFIYFFLSSYLPLLWGAHLTAFQLFDLTALNTLGGTLVGILLYELGLYLWHRTLHHSDVLWRVFHQMHHSAERIDIPSAFYFSPADMIGFTFLGSLCLTLIVGLSPQATTLTLLITTFFSMFQHANIHTPRWLGYIIQRPESHTVHHAKGIHGYNYSDLPVFDILFGTFNNPKTYEHETGFYTGASFRIWDMLLFRDVSQEEVKSEKRTGTALKRKATAP